MQPTTAVPVLRSLADIDREIVETEERLRELHADRHAVVETRRRSIIGEFDAGEHPAVLASRYKLTKSAVQGILLRAGRTMTGRDALRATIQAHCAQPGEARP